MRKLLQSLSRRLLPAANLEITLPSGLHIPIGSRDQISRFEEAFLCKSHAEFPARFQELSFAPELFSPEEKGEQVGLFARKA